MHESLKLLKNKTFVPDYSPMHLLKSEVHYVINVTFCTNLVEKLSSKVCTLTGIIKCMIANDGKRFQVYYKFSHDNRLKYSHSVDK